MKPLRLTMLAALVFGALLGMGRIETGGVGVGTAEAAGGCGPGFHRGPYGACRPNYYGGYYGPRYGYGYRGGVVYGRGAYGYRGGYYGRRVYGGRGYRGGAVYGRRAAGFRAGGFHGGRGFRGGGGRFRR
ncbi:GCG_CRPN prefix-to-repeats domain-containing protein [Methylobacterium durans]